MINDVDIEMAEITAAANHAAAQDKGRLATREDRNGAITDATSHLHFTGGESSHQAMLSAIEDRADVAWTSELRDEIQFIAWERYVVADARENGSF